MLLVVVINQVSQYQLNSFYIYHTVQVKMFTVDFGNSLPPTIRTWFTRADAFAASLVIALAEIAFSKSFLATILAIACAHQKQVPRLDIVATIVSKITQNSHSLSLSLHRSYFKNIFIYIYMSHCAEILITNYAVPHRSKYSSTTLNPMQSDCEKM